VVKIHAACAALEHLYRPGLIPGLVRCFVSGSLVCRQASAFGCVLNNLSMFQTVQARTSKIIKEQLNFIKAFSMVYLYR